MKHLNHQDRLAGLVLIAIGLFVFFYAQRWHMGSLARMGPGMFPSVLGLLLAALGVGIMVADWKSKRPLPSIKLQEAIPTLVGITVFAFLLRPTGLVVATFVSVIIVTILDQRILWPLRLILATSITLFCVVVFKFLLGLPVYLW